MPAVPTICIFEKFLAKAFHAEYLVRRATPDGDSVLRITYSSLQADGLTLANMHATLTITDTVKIPGNKALLDNYIPILINRKIFGPVTSGANPVVVLTEDRSIRVTDYVRNLMRINSRATHYSLQSYTIFPTLTW